MEEVSEVRGLTNGSVPSSCVHLRACLTVYPHGPGLPGALYASLCKSRGAPFGLGTWMSLLAFVHACTPQSHTCSCHRLSQAPRLPPSPRIGGWPSRDRPRLYLLRPLQTPALRCACALALMWTRSHRQTVGVCRRGGTVRGVGFHSSSALAQNPLLTSSCLMSHRPV